MQIILVDSYYKKQLGRIIYNSIVERLSNLDLCTTFNIEWIERKKKIDKLF